VDQKEIRDVIIVDVMVTFPKIVRRHTVRRVVTIVVRKDTFLKNVARNNDQESVTTVVKKVTSAKTVHVGIPKCASFVVNQHICQLIALKSLLMFVTIVMKKDTSAKTVKDPKTLFAISVKRKVTKLWTAQQHPVKLAHAIATVPLVALQALVTEECHPLVSPTPSTMPAIRTGAIDPAPSASLECPDALHPHVDPHTAVRHPSRHHHMEIHTPTHTQGMGHTMKGACMILIHHIGGIIRVV